MIDGAVQTIQYKISTTGNEKNGRHQIKKKSLAVDPGNILNINLMNKINQYG